jgi:hypothetical protein
MPPLPRYTHIVASDRRYHLILGKHFKLALAPQDPSRIPPEYRLPKGCPFSAAELVTTMLTCLKEHAREHLRETVKFDLDASEVHYCLSVPAGW